jgi:hypothetical protein
VSAILSEALFQTHAMPVNSMARLIPLRWPVVAKRIRMSRFAEAAEADDEPGMESEAATAAPASVDNAWELLVFVVDNIAHHVGLRIPRIGIADLSLRGARIIAPDDPSLPEGKLVALPLWLPSPAVALNFLRQPGALDRRIVAQERLCRGWHLTPPAPDFVRTFHETRSLDVDQMNCVEWIARALELGGMEMPDWVMTPNEIARWARMQGDESTARRR